PKGVDAGRSKPQRADGLAGTRAPGRVPDRDVPPRALAVRAGTRVREANRHARGLLMPRHDPRILQLITSTSRRGAETFAVELDAALSNGGFDTHTAALVKGTGRSQLDVEMLGTRRLGLGTLRAIRQRARAADIVIAHGSTTLPAALLATA